MSFEYARWLWNFARDIFLNVCRRSFDRSALHLLFLMRRIIEALPHVDRGQFEGWGGKTGRSHLEERGRGEFGAIVFVALCVLGVFLCVLANGYLFYASRLE